MMTLHKLTVGDGYTYLTRHIAGGDTDRQPGQDATAYYTDHGNPPGRWAGHGLDALGLSGIVSEAQMRHLFGSGMHPDADRIIAEHLRKHTKAGMTEEQLEKLSQQALRAATLGRRFPVYATLEDFNARVAQRLAVIEKETGRAVTQAETGRIRAEEARRARGGVAGYDLVFTPVKSLVLLWALDERPWVRDAVQQAHERARDSALALLEEHAAFTRTGDVGQAQIATKGLVYAMFDHYDSRDGDPNLHTHVAISNKIQGADGGWRALDGRALYRIGVAASEHYNSTVETLATELLGVEFTTRADTVGKQRPIREVTGIPLDWIRTFSARRAQIEARYEDLVVDYRRTHGHDPDNRIAFSLAERANLDTRGTKPIPRALGVLREEWAGRLRAEHGRTARRVLAAVVADHRGEGEQHSRLSTAVSTDQITALGALAVGWAEQSRSTWTRWNLRAEADRMLREPPPSVLPHGLPRIGAEARTLLLDRVVDAAVALSVQVTMAPPLDEPPALRRPDGTSVFVQHEATRYTSQQILDAEQRLLNAARTPTLTVVPEAAVHAVLDGFEATTGTRLDPGQRNLVVAFTTDPHLIAVGLGPAGAGKTTAMRAYQHVLDQQGRRLIPLATSASAAAVLSADLGGTAAENVHKFVYEHLTHGQPTPDHDGRLPAGKAFFQVRAGDVILVDEAGLAGTRNLDTLRDIAQQHGASVRLLGDYRQLSAVESGGALRLLATEAGAVELSELHRFTHPDHAAATRRLREGDSAALDFYTANNRIVGGSAEALLEQAYTAWHTDMTRGLTTLMLAATTSGVTDLSARARADRVTAGHVEPTGVILHDGNIAGVGDWIVTRDNNRKLTANRGKDWVRNGDAWTVTGRHKDGSLAVRHHRHGGTVTLPADYVAAHVELGYATTVHRAQGATVDTAHALITEDMTRETLYVAATRARQQTTLYAVTHRILPVDEDARLDRSIYDRHAKAAREVLEQVLAAEGAQPSATEAIASGRETARSIATVLPMLRHAAEHAATDRLRTLLTSTLDEDGWQVLRDPAWTTVIRTLQEVEAEGWDLPQVLAATARRGPLTAGDSAAQLLVWRINEHIDGRTPQPALAQPSAADATRYAALLRTKIVDKDILNPAEAVTVPQLLHTDPSTGNTNVEAVLALALDPQRAAAIMAEPAWPALRAAIRRAELAGHNPLTIAHTAAHTQPLTGARSISQVLAWRINQHLHHAPAPAGPEGFDAWRTLAWTLKAAENSGRPAELLLSAIPVGGDLDSVRATITTYLKPTPAAGVLPWLPANPATPDTGFRRYLDQADELIQQRQHELTMTAIQQQPAWLAGLGPAPTGDPAAHAVWLRHLGIVAAYRDQHQVTTDDPTHPLGAYQPAESAGHRAFLHAADAVLATRHPHTLAADPATARVAADLYLALPDTDRDAITAALATRLGNDWLGPRHGDADTLITAAFYATHLQAELETRGLLYPAPSPAASSAPGSSGGTEQVISRRRVIAPPAHEHPAPQPGIDLTY
ncbi:MobF family relaxase [Actinoplanes sp. RD1]|uniref:MobF family relaxase n=1 Tax=Actinoplanes sp. RD1 TaxID=3064538 RepID=UPI0027410956|nr:MobF family relaxase [Actinoplanes sp. RD1]